jgi:hypothetical protein
VTWREDTGRSAAIDAPIPFVFPMGAFRMNLSEQARFDRLYAKAIEAVKLHGLRKKTIDSYCLTLRRVANFFGRCPDKITSDE